MVGAIHRAFRIMKHPGGLQHIFLQGASVAVTRIALIGASLVSSIIVARALPLDERGRLGLLLAVAALAVQFGHFGLPVANAYLVARKPAMLPELVANTSRIYAAIIAFLLIGCAGAIHNVPSWSVLWGAAGVMVWLVSITGLAQLLVQNFLVGQFRFSASNGVELIARVGMIAGMAALWGTGMTNAVWFSMATAVFTGLAGIWGMIRGGMRFTLGSWNPSIWRQQIHLGGRAYLACIASFVLSRLPLYGVESRGGLTGLAFYTQALSISDTMLVVPIALGTVVFPNMASTRDSGTRIRSTLRLAAITTAVMALGASAAVLLGPYLLPLVYGKAYSASMPILLTMLPGVVALGVCSVVQNALSANGYPWVAVASPLAGVLAVALALSVSSTVQGCGWAYSAGGLVMLICSSVGWWFHRYDWSEASNPATVPGAGADSL
jgi:O-antigen/teichoic acid export membrane protein